MRSDGVIATNYHIIKGAISALVYLANGDIYDEVSILDTDVTPSTDRLDWPLADASVPGRPHPQA